MKITKKVLSMILALVMVLGLLPATTFATGENVVYISVSDDGQFINDTSGNAMAYTPVALDDLAAIDLNEYGLTDYLYDADGDGSYEVTALHLYIYTHEVLLGGDWSSEVTVTGGAGSAYMQSGLFGFSDENLRYNYNGAYPADENGWGFTCDRIVLSAGDFLEVAHYSDWSFYMDSAYGFHYFTDENDEISIAYTAETDTPLSLKLTLVGGGMGMGDTQTAEVGYTVYYGQSIGNATDSVTTDDSGALSITFPSAGIWYVWCEGGYGVDMAPGAIVSSPASATVTVTAAEIEEPSQPEQPRQPQDVSAVLNATMAQLAATVTEPAFGTNAGEWTVLSLARGGYYAKDNTYFTDYYNRIVETVNTTAASVNMSGALHKNKSTDNARLIVVLSSIGKNATAVGDWDLVEAYSANGLTWIKKQGLNGPIWALIALDSNNYATTDATLRQQCVDYILSMELDGGGWALNAATAELDVDITGMTLQALYPYRDQTAVAAAAERAFTRLSNEQLETGGFMYGTGETSESAAQVIVACATWGINPDTDSRFIKNGKSVVDNLLSYYIEDEAMFAHQGTTSNGMATDQACYALIAYDRLVKGQNALYDMTDVTFDPIPESDEMTATLGLPAEINPGSSFNGVVSINKWDNAAGYKLIDLIVNIPSGVAVTGVTAGGKLTGGEVSWNLEAETGKLRIVYFDANSNSTLTVTGEEFPAELFNIAFQATGVAAGSKVDIAISGMSVKLTSDSAEEASMVEVNTDKAKDTVNVVAGLSFSAKCLYQGDDVDLIPSTKKAVAVAVTGISGGAKLTYNDAQTPSWFKYSAEITAKTGVATYVALVDAGIAMENFVNANYFTIPGGNAAALTFGDANGDGVINAQDALAVVDTWLRKSEEPTDDEILTMNVNGDSRINTFDALGIVEAFVNDTEYIVITKAATITANQ